MTYIHGHGHARANHATRTATDSAAFLLPHLTKDTRLLDVGCGPGTITRGLADRIVELGGSPGQVAGVDRTIDAPSSPSDPRFLRGDIYALPVPDDTMDVVFVSQTLHHLPDPVAAIRECARVLRPGGLFAIREVDYGAMTWFPPNPGITRWRALFTVVADLQGMQPNAGRHLPTWMERAEWSDYDVSASMWSYGTPSERQRFADSWIARTQEDHYRRHAARALGDQPDGAAVREAIDQITMGWTQWRDTPGALFLMPHVEILARKAQKAQKAQKA